MKLGLKSVALLATVAAFAVPAAAHASTIKGNVTGYYYGNQVYATNNSQAWSYISSHSASATFTSTGINYPSFLGQASDSNTLTSFLGATDAATLTNASTVGSNSLQGQMIRFLGSIYLPAGGTTFVLGSDDGSVLSIGGSQLIDYGGQHGFSTQTATFTATTAGWYSLDLLYYEYGGSTGVSLGTMVNGSAQSLSFQPTAAAVPIPASAAGGLALFGVILGRKIIRRR